MTTSVLTIKKFRKKYLNLLKYDRKASRVSRRNEFVSINKNSRPDMFCKKGVLETLQNS